MTCEIRVINDETQVGISYPVDCDYGKYEIEDYNVTGDAKFSLVVTDTEGVTDIRSIEKTFFEYGTTSLEIEDAQLIMDRVIEPGKFSFELVVEEGILDMRNVKIKPVIYYQDTKNDLKGTYLQSTGITDLNKNNTFKFTLSTTDFEFRIPEDKSVEFTVELNDDYGTELIASKNVMFRFEQEETPVASIRGKSVDVVNYMSDLAINGFNAGFNVVDFKVENHELEGKDLSITLISRDLGIDHHAEVKLGGKDSQRVMIPVYIPENTEAGVYDARISVFDGEDKQSRYSRVIVN
jgi:hypothetical protein